MRRTALFLAAVSMVVGAANLSAQKPNFAGTWTRIVDPNAPATDGRGGAPDALTIRQDAKTLTMMMLATSGSAPEIVFNLDSTDTKQTVTDPNGNQSEQASRANWDGSKLVVTMTRKSNGTSSTATFAYSFDASGNLVVAVTQTPRGGASMTMTSSYKKK